MLQVNLSTEARKIQRNEKVTHISKYQSRYFYNICGMDYKVNKIIYGTDRSLSNTKRKGYFEICLYLRVHLTN